MSDRYRAIASLLEDPLNQICILREYTRRGMGAMKFLVPPVPRKGGGWVFPTLCEAMETFRPVEYSQDDQVDSVFEVFTDGVGWFVSSSQEDLEVGPFDEEGTALQEARQLARQEGYTLLDKLPWDHSDITNWVL